MELTQRLEADGAREHSHEVHFADAHARRQDWRVRLLGTPRLPDLGDQTSTVFHLVDKGGEAFAQIGLHRDPDAGPVHLWMPCAKTYNPYAGAHAWNGGTDSCIGKRWPLPSRMWMASSIGRAQ